MTKLWVATKVRFNQLADRKEAGQGTLEYLGIVIIAVILVGAVIAAINGFGLQDKISDQLNKIGS